MRAFLYPEGSRVRVKRGHFPIDGELVGRTGIVHDTSPYRPGRYEVVLDGESEPREFAEEELEPEEGEIPGTVPESELPAGEDEEGSGGAGDDGADGGGDAGG